MGNAHKITSYFCSDLCCLCGQKSNSKWGVKAAVCGDCQQDKARSVDEAQRRLRAFQLEAHALARQCSRCNLCFEDSSTFAEERFVATKDGKGRISQGVITPLANCTSIDCPITYERHRMREELIQAAALCKTLDVD
jgi:C4-type zinc-finger of DNA polymerase delta